MKFILVIHIRTLFLEYVVKQSENNLNHLFFSSGILKTAVYFRKNLLRVWLIARVNKITCVALCNWICARSLSHACDFQLLRFITHRKKGALTTMEGDSCHNSSYPCSVVVLPTTSRGSRCCRTWIRRAKVLSCVRRPSLGTLKLIVVTPATTSWLNESM